MSKQGDECNLPDVNVQGRGYTEQDVEHAASEVTGENLHAWFDRYVGGTDDLDYEPLLAKLGLRLVRGDSWRIEEVPGATPDQRRVRDGWITGTRG